MLMSFIFIPLVVAHYLSIAPILAEERLPADNMIAQASADNPIAEADIIYLDAVQAIKGEQYEIAIEKLKKMLELLPNFAEGYMAYGMVLDRQGKNSEAIIQYEKSVTLKPGLAVAWINLASVHQKTGDLQSALTDLKKYLELSPDAPNAESVRQHIEILNKQVGVDELNQSITR
jgi:tetratricopeptide (TPR) repeat protein